MRKRLSLITGDQYGEWTVIEKAENNLHNQTQYKCKCSCGFLKNISASNLKRGHSKKCRRCSGIVNRKLYDFKAEHKVIVGYVEKNWTIIEILERPKEPKKRYFARCKIQCFCGNERTIEDMYKLSRITCWECKERKKEELSLWYKKMADQRVDIPGQIELQEQRV